MSYLLLVEDDPDVREVMGALLAEEGIEARMAVNAREGLGIVDRQGPPALVILDILLGDDSGTDLLDGLKERRLLGQVPISVSSAVDHARVQGVCARYDLPVELCLDKPFEIESLLAVLRRFMR